MRVFVTGGTGFIGSHVVELLRRRHAVTCLVRRTSTAVRVFGEQPPALLVGDLGDPSALERGCADADAVVHLAGLTAARSRAELFAVNAGGTRTLADAVRTAGIGVRRFVLVSSLAAAGPVRDGGATIAGDEAQPVSDYGRSKLAGEEPVRGLPLAWTILRPPVVYGPRDRELLRLFRIVRRGIAPVVGDGSQRLSLVFAADLADAVARCVETPPAPGVYYPAHGESTTARALAEAVAAALGVAARTVRVPRAVVRPLLWINGRLARLAGHASLLAADKAAEILAAAWTCAPAALEASTGWRATTSLGAGLRQTAQWYRAAGWL